MFWMLGADVLVLMTEFGCLISSVFKRFLIFDIFEF